VKKGDNFTTTTGLDGTFAMSVYIPDGLSGSVLINALASNTDKTTASATPITVKSLAENGLLTNPVHVLDLAFLLPGMLAAAYLLRRGAFAGRLAAAPLLIFAVTMGLGILAGFAFSAARGLPVPLPAVVLVGAIVAAGAVLTALFLREAGDG
jgi:hypothetical protein